MEGKRSSGVARIFGVGGGIELLAVDSKKTWGPGAVRAPGLAAAENFKCTTFQLVFFNASEAQIFKVFGH